MTAKLKAQARMPKEEAILKNLSSSPYKVSAEESMHDEDVTTAQDYDRWFLAAVRERKMEQIVAGYGALKHPTSRLFEIGVDSIRAGKASQEFLLMLEKIGRMAEDIDVMATMFPKEFPRRIRTNTVRAAQRDAETIAKFKAHLSSYLEVPSRARNGKKGIEWIPKTFAEAMADYKAVLTPDQAKSLDRALEKQGSELRDWRDAFAKKRHVCPNP
jgi:hypothetical protein